MSLLRTGEHFTADSRDPILLSWAAAGNLVAPSVLPEYAAACLVARPAEGSGLGVFMRDGCTAHHGATLAAYWGHLCRDPDPASAYLLDVPVARLGDGTTSIFIDARRQCCRPTPPPTHAGLINHACEDPSCAPYLLRLPGCPMPVVSIRTRRSLRGGTELTYNYDSHLRSGAYTVGAEEAAFLLSAGEPCVPCRCAAPLPCPQRRFFT